MERNKIILLLVFWTNLLFGQGLFVQYQHPVYSFLERMEAGGLITNYSNESKPIQRTKIVHYLEQIFDYRDKLNETDKKFLDYFIKEFFYDLTGRLDRYNILFSKESYEFFDDREKFIYAYSSRDEFSLFVKSHINFSSISYRNQPSAATIEAGGRFYGSVSNFLGFELDATNGIVTGSKQTALKLHDLSYNFKLNEKPESKFYDKSYGYISVEFPYISLKIGRDRKIIGYGLNKLILSDYPPEFDLISFDINYKAFSFEYFHGWLKKSFPNPEINNKYFAHHRIAFSPSKNFKLGAGESIIYLRPSVQIDYLNPFNFYKSIEHQLQDQDNALLYFDAEFFPIKNLRIYTTFLIDDIDFAQIGKNWFGNKTALNIGTELYYPFLDLPLHFGIEYTRIEPYTFTHHLQDRNYTNSIYSLSTDQPPNSYKLNFKAEYSPSPWFNFSVNYSFTKWGKNYYENGELINVGGDINLGKRENDSELVKFLNGKLETINSLDILSTFEFIRNIKLTSRFNFLTNSSHSNTLFFSIGLISFL